MFSRRRPYLGMGWLWFVVTLLPVIGLLQVGKQAMADRYTYVPLIGIFVIVAWGVPDMLARFGIEMPKHRALTGVIVGLVLAVLMVCTWFQVGYWKDNVTLFEHAAAVTDNNAYAHFALGNAYQGRGDMDRAMSEYDDALSVEPGYADAHCNLGLALMGRSDLQGAYEHLSEAVRLNPDSPDAQNNLGIVLARTGKLEEAASHFSKALDIDPQNGQYRSNLEKAEALLQR